MPVSILLHLTRGSENENATLVAKVVGEMLDTLKCTLVRVPTSGIPWALRDADSDEVLCIRHYGVISPNQHKALRWAAHKRHRPPAEVKAQLQCDVFQLDQSRIETGWKAKKRQHEKDRRKR